jgi:NADPH:quinone reductase-like Zn-dependent oxidoreductase
MATNLESLALKGRIVVIAIAGGRTFELDLSRLMRRRGRICASTLRARSLEDKAATARAVERGVVPLLDAGRVRVPVFAEYAMSDAAAAYERFTTGGKLGKIVLVT